MKSNLIAFNITSDKKILTDSEIPILYSWNRKIPFEDDVKKSEKMKRLLKDIGASSIPSIWNSAKISYFIYDGNRCSMNSIYIRDMFPIYECEDIENYVSSTYVKVLLEYMFQYGCVDIDAHSAIETAKKKFSLSDMTMKMHLKHFIETEYKDIFKKEEIEFLATKIFKGE